MLYLAGPMSGIRDFNFPAFSKAARLLREHGYRVINPAESFSGDQSLPWQDYVDYGVAMIKAMKPAIVVLPGWQESKGAHEELRAAIELGLHLYSYVGYYMAPDDEAIICQWRIREAENLCLQAVAACDKVIGRQEND